MKRLFILFLILLLLTSCWNRREMNEMSITYGLGIDKQDNEYIVTAQVINPEQVSAQQGGGSTTQSPVIIHESKDKSILHAIRKLTRTAPRKIYVSHLYILVIGEAVAKDGVGDVLDLIYRDQEFRTNFVVFIAKDSTAKEILSTPTPFSAAPSNEIFDRIHYSNRHFNPTKETSIRELLTKTVTEGIEPAVPSLMLIGGNEEGGGQSIPKPTIPTGNVAVFYQDKLKGWLSEEQADTYSTITSNIKDSVSNFPCGDEGYGVLEAKKVETRLKPIYKEKPLMKIEIKYEGSISELDCKQTMTTPESIRKLEKQIALHLEKEHTKNVKEIQEEPGIDIFGFGREYFRKKPDEWKKMKEDWPNIFKQLPVELSVEVRVTKTGTIDDSFLNKIQGGK